jgi:hypothetical protein
MPVPIIAYGAQTGRPPVVGSTDMPLPERLGGVVVSGAGSTVRDGVLCESLVRLEAVHWEARRLNTVSPLVRISK